MMSVFFLERVGQEVGWKEKIKHLVNFQNEKGQKGPAIYPKKQEKIY